MQARDSYLVHVANPCLLYRCTALGVSHEGQQMLLEDIFGIPVKAAVVLPRLLEVVFLLNGLLHTHTGHRLLWPAVVAHGLAGAFIVNVILLGWVVVHLYQGDLC